jgi:hypothetical protein
MAVAAPNLCLGAITMMGVDIEDYGSLSCGICGIEGIDRKVTMTEPDTMVAACMMPWRS